MILEIGEGGFSKRNQKTDSQNFASGAGQDFPSRKSKQLVG